MASLPFLVIIAGLAVSFWKELHTDCGPVTAPSTGSPRDRADRHHHRRKGNNDMSDNDDRRARIQQAWDAAWDRGEVDAFDDC